MSNQTLDGTAKLSGNQKGESQSDYHAEKENHGNGFKNYLPVNGHFRKWQDFKKHQSADGIFFISKDSLFMTKRDGNKARGRFCLRIRGRKLSMGKLLSVREAIRIPSGEAA